MQDFVTASSVHCIELRQRLQNRLAGRQFHPPTHRVEIEPRIDQSPIQIEDYTANHADILVASRPCGFMTRLVPFAAHYSRHRPARTYAESTNPLIVVRRPCRSAGLASTRRS